MSANANPIPTATLDEYLALDEASAIRFEFDDGFVTAMAPPSFRHTVITTNISTALNVRLKDRDCRAFSSTLRVLIEAENARLYPDVVVICGEPQIVREHGDSVINPLIVFEVTSPESKKYDLDEKREIYQAIPSLVQYVTIAQDSAHSVSWTRHGNLFERSDAAGLDDSLELSSIGVVLPFAEIYGGVSFD